ncbi:hypothetical protein GPK32_04195 [Lactiplantibacillus plantarum]|uniref:hypothetical protein n=1 Tax=Lactiplantibacillus plantarum TaxID=1590 RepID=UPI0012FA808B|nr:hypothetical protein [Lactiplantibacillus plantarum]QGX68179.1 hypothetical protein GPK32_04195 [Lactiplantibacillus plantarum]
MEKHLLTNIRLSEKKDRTDSLQELFSPDRYVGRVGATIYEQYEKSQKSGRLSDHTKNYNVFANMKK